MKALKYVAPATKTRKIENVSLLNASVHVDSTGRTVGSEGADPAVVVHSREFGESSIEMF